MEMVVFSFEQWFLTWVKTTLFWVKIFPTYLLNYGIHVLFIILNKIQLAVPYKSFVFENLLWEELDKVNIRHP